MDNFSVKKSFESGKGFIPALLLVVGALIIVGIILATQVYKTPAPAGPANTTAEVPGASSVPGVVSLMLDPMDVSVALDKTVKLDVNIDTTTDSVSAVELHLTYDPAYLDATSVTNGTFLPVVLQVGKIAGGKASIIVGSNPTTPKKGTGTVATIMFKALKAGSTQVMVDSATQVASVGKTASTLGSTTGTTVTIK